MKQLSKTLVSTASAVIPNRFMLTVVVAKRARQIKDGMRPMVEFDHDNPPNPIDLALMEVAAGKISVDMDSHYDSEEEYIQEIESSLEIELEKQESNPQVKDQDEKKKEPRRKSKSLAA
jgi:DNA-directed RNA polymerase subunit omega